MTRSPPPPARPTRVLKFTDTFADINGVCRFIQNIAASAHDTGRDLTVFTSTRMPMPPVCARIDNVVNFEPIYARKMPGYDTLDLAIPPVITMLRAAEAFDPDVIHISTPGPVGTVGMIAAKLMRRPIVGVYHTDFPAYIDELFHSRLCSRACRAYMGLFYRQFCAVFSRSADYADRLRSLGISPGRIERLEAGYDNTQFDSALRDTGVWAQHGIAAGSVKAVFCGRVSTEKNLPLLVRIWPEVRRRVRRAGGDIDLIIIGDGPYRPDMEKALAGHGAHFLGFRHGTQLATLYASCDLFVFPSTTDTLGQVVMEAQGSGLPVIITDQGGPKEIVRTQHDASPSTPPTAIMLGVHDQNAWIDAIVELSTDDPRRQRMGAAGVELMKQHTFEASFEHYWQVHQAAHQQRR